MVNNTLHTEIMFYFGLLLAFVCMGMTDATTTVCSSSSALVQDLQVITNPVNPMIGSEYNLTLTFSTPQDIVEGSTQKIKMVFDGFPVSNDKVSLCDELAKTGYSCPIVAGKYDMSWVATIPTDTPSGQLKGSQVWSTVSGEEILCFHWQFNL